MALYANENFSHRVVDELRRLGHDVLTSREAGNAGRSVPDEDVLKFAIAARRAVLTFNRRDFLRLHRTDSVHAGIVVCTYDADSAALAARIHAQLAAHAALDGLLLRVNRPAK